MSINMINENRSEKRGGHSVADFCRHRLIQWLQRQIEQQDIQRALLIIDCKTVVNMLPSAVDAGKPRSHESPIYSCLIRFELTDFLISFNCDIVQISKELAAILRLSLYFPPIGYLTNQQTNQQFFFPIHWEVHAMPDISQYNVHQDHFELLRSAHIHHQEMILSASSEQPDAFTLPKNCRDWQLISIKRQRRTNTLLHLLFAKNVPTIPSPNEFTRTARCSTRAE